MLILGTEDAIVLLHHTLVLLGAALNGELLREPGPVLLIHPGGVVQGACGVIAVKHPAWDKDGGREDGHDEVECHGPLDELEEAVHRRAVAALNAAKGRLPQSELADGSPDIVHLPIPGGDLLHTPLHDGVNTELLHLLQQFTPPLLLLLQR